MSEASQSLRAVERGLAVLSALADPADPLSVSQVATKVGFSRAAVRRVLLTLCELGYVTESRPGRYAPRANVLRLGWRTLALRPLADLARPVLEDLSERTGHIAVLSRRLGVEIIVEAAVVPHDRNVFHVSAGDRLPPMTSDAGRLLYSNEDMSDPVVESLLRGSGDTVVRFSAAVAAAAIDGYCLVDQEMEPGLVSLGVPVRGREGSVPAALSLYAYAGAMSATALLGHLPALADSSARLESDLLRGAAAFALQ